MAGATSSRPRLLDRPSQGTDNLPASPRVVAAYVRKLQRHESHPPCFMTEACYECMDLKCPWRVDCVRLVAEFFR